MKGLSLREILELKKRALKAQTPQLPTANQPQPAGNSGDDGGSGGGSGSGGVYGLPQNSSAGSGRIPGGGHVGEVQV